MDEKDSLRGGDDTAPDDVVARGRARLTTSRRSLLVGGTGAALGVAAAAVVPGSAEAADGSSADRGRHRFTTRVPVAPGVQVAVTDLDGGRKGTVVLVPGWPLSSVMLENTTLFLADRGYRAVALDLRGFGESDAPYGPYGYDVWCSDIRTVLRTMNLRDVTLVGHSMGGAVALRYAARFRSRVSRLVVAEPAAPRFVYGPKSADLTAGLAGLIEGYANDRSQVVRALTKTFFSTHTDVTTDPFLQFFERQGLDGASLVASRAGLYALRDTDLTADLRRISIPTRVFHALNDQIVPYDHGQAVAAAVRGATLVTFTTAGHGVYIDERDKFNAELLAFAAG
ncbi:alpha/beta hydrolase [Microlunatus spumicola]|uniref:Alpha/beta hydrolase n=1 Tax=Microlunatus spumicola TaxID=81499 RepID=A0ABP6WN42_9ACTN